MPIEFAERDAAASERAIDVYFDFVSPYGWIAAEKIGEVAARFARPLRWHPILLKVTVLDAMGLPPPLETPLKGPYLRHDIARSLRHHGLRLTDSARFGFSSLAAARAAIWARRAAPDHLHALILALYRAHWSGGRDISRDDTVLDVIAEIGLPRSGAAEALQSDAIKKALADEVAAAICAGVFGSPTFVVDGETFWGADRIPMVEAWIASGGW
ncbi:2-hydroxychromene-2-carboxylate isomerase [Sphingopyxis jiangsuensis]|uniref:2-hydroxychromene-2-carboxylate isomerase n=1 Tax=Sphingopyxis jiangsuensis TaxID=2871171 RepID=UPI002ED3AF0B